MGRPPQTRGVYAFNAGKPFRPAAGVVLDTSFVIEALIPEQPLHGPCRDYLSHLVASEMTLFFNRLLELELQEAAYKIALREKFGSKRGKAMRSDGRVSEASGQDLRNPPGVVELAARDGGMGPDRP